MTLHWLIPLKIPTQTLGMLHMTQVAQSGSHMCGLVKIGRLARPACEAVK